MRNETSVCVCSAQTRVVLSDIYESPTAQTLDCVVQKIFRVFLLCQILKPGGNVSIHRDVALPLLATRRQAKTGKLLFTLLFHWAQMP